MGQKTVDQVATIERVVGAETAQVEAARQLGLSKWHVRGLVEAYREAGREAVRKYTGRKLAPLPKGRSLELELNRLSATRETGNWPSDAKLRVCQLDAFVAIRTALEEFKSKGSRDVAGETDRGRYVVQMATGTGKTGVIACCAFAMPAVSKCLIVVPSDVLRAQFQRELSTAKAETESFWAKCKLEPGHERKVQIARGEQLDALRVEPGSVVITTIQSLQSRHASTTKGRNELLQQLRKFDLVLFDEGHRKPADAWDLAVEELRTPTVLFTATPYRADGKPLNARPIQSFTLSDSVDIPSAQRFLRGVEFIGLDLKEGHIAAYVDDLIHELASATESGDLAEHRPRIIVRGRDFDEVEELLELFQQAHAEGGLPSAPAAIHSRYTPNSASGRHRMVRTVPADAQVLIHEDILLEGYDDPRVLLIALPALPGDATVLIQQVGRALRWNRNSSWSAERQAHAKVFVPTPASDTDAIWATYQRYEANPSAYEVRDGSFWPSSGGLANLDELDLLRVLRVRLNVRVFAPDRKLSTDDLLAEVKRWTPLPPIRALSQTDKDVRAVVVFFEEGGTPDFLLSGYVEVRLGMHCVAVCGEHLFVATSDFASVSRRAPWKQVDIDQLLSLVPPTSNIQSVRLRNLDTGEGTIRAKSLIAERSERHVSTVREGGFVVQSLGWWNAQSKLGPRERLSTSSMSFGSASRQPLESFMVWCRTLERRLQSASTTRHVLLSRVASRTKVRSQITPYLLRLDLDGEADELAHAVRTTTGWAASNLFVPESTSIFAELKRTATDGRWAGRLVLPGEKSTRTLLPGVFVTRDKDQLLRLEWATHKGMLIKFEGKSVNLLRWAQERRKYLILANGGLTFANGELYRRAAPTEEYVKATVTASALFDGCTEEVEGRATGKGWAASCVFARLEKAFSGRGEWAGFDLIICDDGANEWADYLALQLGGPIPRFVLIHAKCSFTKPKVADAAVFSRLQIRDLYVVLGQATKNAHLLWATPDAKQRKRWAGRHAISKEPRIVSGAASDLARIEELVRNPQTRREVWVVQSMLDANALLEKAKHDDRPGNVARMLQLIEHTSSAIGSQGASFRVFGNALG